MKVADPNIKVRGQCWRQHAGRVCGVDHDASVWRNTTNRANNLIDGQKQRSFRCDLVEHDESCFICQGGKDTVGDFVCGLRAACEINLGDTQSALCAAGDFGQSV